MTRATPVDYTLSAASSASVTAGDSVGVDVTATIGTYSSDINITGFGDAAGGALPTGITADTGGWTAGAYSSPVTIHFSTDAALAPGDYTVYVGDTDTGTHFTSAITLHVAAPPTPSYSLQADTSSFNLASGAGGTVTPNVTATGTNGWAGTAALDLAGDNGGNPDALPAGFSKDASGWSSIADGQSTAAPIVVDPSVADGTYNLLITSTDGSLTFNLPITVTVGGGGGGGGGPSIDMQGPSTLNVAPGGTAGLGYAVNPGGTLSGTQSVCAYGDTSQGALPTGLSSSGGSYDVSTYPTGGNVDVLVDPATPDGDYTVYLGLCDGSLYSAAYDVHVGSGGGGSATIELQAPSGTVAPGDTQSIQYRVNPNGALSGTQSVCLFTDDGSGGYTQSMPAGILAPVGTSYDTGTYPAYAGIDAATTAEAGGTYTLYVGLCDGSLYSAPYTLNVGTAPGYQYTLDSNEYTVAAGGSFTTNATITPVNGFADTVSFNWDGGNPAGFSAPPWPQIDVPANSTAGLEVDVAPDVAPGDYQVTIWAHAQTVLVPDQAQQILVHVQSGNPAAFVSVNPTVIADLPDATTSVSDGSSLSGDETIWASISNNGGGTISSPQITATSDADPGFGIPWPVTAGPGPDLLSNGDQFSMNDLSNGSSISGVGETVHFDATVTPGTPSGGDATATIDVTPDSSGGQVNVNIDTQGPGFNYGLVNAYSLPDLTTEFQYQASASGGHLSWGIANVVGGHTYELTISVAGLDPSITTFMPQVEVDSTDGTANTTPASATATYSVPLADLGSNGEFDFQSGNSVDWSGVVNRSTGIRFPAAAAATQPEGFASVDDGNVASLPGGTSSVNAGDIFSADSWWSANLSKGPDTGTPTIQAPTISANSDAQPAFDNPTPWPDSVNGPDLVNDSDTLNLNDLANGCTGCGSVTADFGATITPGAVPGGGGTSYATIDVTPQNDTQNLDVEVDTAGFGFSMGDITDATFPTLSGGEQLLTSDVSGTHLSWQINNAVGGQTYELTVQTNQPNAGVDPAPWAPEVRVLTGSWADNGPASGTSYVINDPSLGPSGQWTFGAANDVAWSGGTWTQNGVDFPAIAPAGPGALPQAAGGVNDSLMYSADGGTDSVDGTATQSGNESLYVSLTNVSDDGGDPSLDAGLTVQNPTVTAQSSTRTFDPPVSFPDSANTAALAPGDELDLNDINNAVLGNVDFQTNFDITRSFQTASCDSVPGSCVPDDQLGSIDYSSGCPAATVPGGMTGGDSVPVGDSLEAVTVSVTPQAGANTLGELVASAGDIAGDASAAGIDATLVGCDLSGVNGQRYNFGDSSNMYVGTQMAGPTTATFLYQLSNTGGGGAEYKPAIAFYNFGPGSPTETIGTSASLDSTSLGGQLDFTADNTVDWHLSETASTGVYLNGNAAAGSAADGSGTLYASTSVVTSGSTGNTLGFDYVADGPISNGTVTLTVPDGWSAPSTSSSDPGYVTSSQGDVQVNGQTITVAGLVMNGGDDLTITYGDTSQGGPGATAPGTLGDQVWQAQEQSTDTGVLTDLAAGSPTITLIPPDGAGTMTVSPDTVLVGATGQTLTFTYTAGTGGIDNGSVAVAVPDGWSQPSTDPSEPGYATSSNGDAGVFDNTIVAQNVTLAEGETMTITYGDTSGGGPGATAPSSGSSDSWSASEASTAFGSLEPLADSPTVTVTAVDGSGSMTVDPTHAGVSSTGNTLVFTYTADQGGLSNGSVSLTVPSGWSPPSTGATDAGYVTQDWWGGGTVSVNGQTITVSGLTMSEGDSFDIVYGDTGGGGPGATAPATGGDQTWQAQEASTDAGTLTDLASSPDVSLVAADGSGTMIASPTVVNVSATGVTETFTYTAAAGGISGGSVAIDVPFDWDAPSTSPADNGYSTSTAGDLSVAGSTIEVDNLNLSQGQTFTITYGDKTGGGAGADAPASGGTEEWTAYEWSTADGNSTPLASSPDITVVSPDGSGTVTADPNSAGISSTHNTLYFTYTADAGGLQNGAVTLTVPAGWSAPSTSQTAPGYTSVDNPDATVSVAGQVITVSGLTLDEGSEFTIAYGDMTHGSSGAKAPATAGPQTWAMSEKSTPGGTLTALADQPSVEVIGAPKVTSATDDSTGNSTGLVGDPVTITGSGFTYATDVQFNGQSVDDFTIVSDTEIDTNVPDSTTGPVKVFTPGGSNGTGPTFSIVRSPEIDSFSPASGKVGTVVTINGSGFTGVKDPTFGELDFGGTQVDVSTITFVSDSQIKVAVPAGAVSGPITVGNMADSGSSLDDFTVINQPSIDSFDPPQGGVGTSVTITGSGFDVGQEFPSSSLESVKFNGKLATDVDVQDDGTIVASVPSGATTGKITVTNAAGTATSADSFTVVLPPTISGFTPAIGLADDTTQVTITGTHLASVSEIDFDDGSGGAAPVDNIVSQTDTKIVVTVPTAAGTGPITVINEAGQATSSKSFGVIVAPEVDSFSPDSGKAGQIVTLNGSGFTGTTSVTFPSATTPKTAKFKVVDDGTMQVTVPTGAITGPITVTNPADSADSFDDFTVIQKPVISSFTGSPGIVGDSVVLTGTGFTGATTVKFNGVGADFDVIDDTEIDTTVPYGAKTGKITVATIAGIGSSPTSFTVIPPPTISSFTDTATKSLNGVPGDTLTITGTNLTNVSEVDIGDSTDALFAPVGTTGKQLTVTVPDDADSGQITVVTDHGNATGAKSFGLIVAPVIDSLSSTEGKVGTIVQIFGSGFLGTKSVTFAGPLGTRKVAKFTFVDDGTLKATVPTGAVTGTIQVTNWADMAESTDTYVVIVKPKITSISPTSGGAGDTLTINGSGLLGVYAVKFAGVPADGSTISINADGTQLTVTVPGGAKKGKVTVTNVAGSVTSAQVFTPIT